MPDTPDPEQPDDKGQSRGGLKAFLARAMPWLRRQRGTLAAASASVLLFVLLDMIPFFLYRVIFDQAVPEQDLQLFTWLFVALVALLIVRWGLAAARAIYFGRLSGRTGAEIRQALLGRVQSIDLNDARVNRRAEVIALFSADIEAVETAVLADLPRALMGVFTLGLGLAALAIFDWRLTLMLVVLIPTTGIVAKLLGPRVQAAARARDEARSSLQVCIDDVVRGQRTIRAFGLTGWWRARFAERDARLRDHAVSVGALTVGQQVSMFMGTLTLITTVIIVASAMAFFGWLTLGTVFAYLGLLGVVSSGVMLVSESAAGLARGLEGLGRIDTLLDAPPKPVDGDPAPPLSAGIRLDAVELAFGDRTVLDRLNLEFPRGESVALVGPSGAGKSTVLNVLLGFNAPRGGRVMWDDHDFHALDLPSVRGHMATVFQETYIFSLTIAENIRVGRPDATDDEVRAAARAAEFDDVVQALPDGYDTRLGDGHHQLSGGQRQRLGIARAVLRQPDVLLLDEATSALDPSTEAEINQTLGRLGRDRTVISVTHRLEGARTADRICVLQNGQLAEQGTHDALLAADGLYASLYQRQTAVKFDGVEATIDPSLLAVVPLFAALSDEVRAELADSFVMERRRKGDVVIQAGDPGERFYVVARGALGVFAPPEQGGKRWNTMRDADVFGEVALLADTHRTATVIAESETTLLTLDRKAFQALIDAHPEARATITAEAEKRAGALGKLPRT